MSPDTQREAALFQAAAQLSGAARLSFLDGACHGNPDLRQRLDALLAAHEQTGGALADEQPLAMATMKVALADTPDETVGQRIGPAGGRGSGRYKILEKVGEGGCGVVYVAEQTEPVRRRVALKVIKLGMDTKQVVARFEAERQALAMMDHPNIARVLDAGATETGRPYFVMELVRGIKITDYCDQNNLPTRERLALFIQVCQAIQHAHQKGIIHRDIKPSNILVTVNDGVPVPKVIDFGIAKATEGRLSEHTVYTQLHQFIGTPAYMSPEQAEMTSLDIDTRSDIYSLGVLLYELLTGRTPFDGRELISQGIDAMRKTIREQEPAKPSTRLAALKGEDLTTAARRRSVEAAKLPKLVQGDLDWIVMKCLEKDRTRRYETANGLAADLKRHLSDEPVVARPPSKLYEFQRTVRRHKVGFAATAAVMVALSAGVVMSALQAVRARQAEKLAKDRLTQVGKERDAKELARQDAEAISKFLSEVFQSPDPARDGRTITVAETLDKAAKKLETDLAIQPERRAKLQATLGLTYRALGLPRKAIPLQEKVRDYYLAHYGLEHPETLLALNNLAFSYANAGRQNEAHKLEEEVLPLHRKVHGPKHHDTLLAMNNLGLAYVEANRWGEALKLLEELLALRLEVDGPEHPDTLLAMNNLAVCYVGVGRRAEALKLREEVLPLRRKVSGLEHPLTIKAMHNLAKSYREDGRRAKALQLLEEALPLCQKLHGPEHRDTISVMNDLALSYRDEGRPAEALDLAKAARTLSGKVNGPEHPDTLLMMYNLALILNNAGLQAEALQLEEEVLPLYLKLHGPDHPDTISAMNNLALSYRDAGRRTEAIQLQEEVLTLSRKVHGPEHPLTLLAMNNLAGSYMAGTNFAQAEPLLSELLAHARKTPSRNASEQEARLADVRYRLKKYPEAAEVYQERLQTGLLRPGGETSDTVLGTRASLGRLYSDWAWAERATNATAAHQRAIEGEKLLRETLAVREADPKYPAGKRAELQSRLGGALSVLAFTDPALTAPTREPMLLEAEALLQLGQAGMEEHKSIEAKYRRDGIERFIRLYEAWGKQEKLAEWKRRLATFDEAEAKRNKPVQP